MTFVFCHVTHKSFLMWKFGIKVLGKKINEHLQIEDLEERKIKDFIDNKVKVENQTSFYRKVNFIKD